MGMGLRTRLGKIYLGTSSVYFKCNPLYSSGCVCVCVCRALCPVCCVCVTKIPTICECEGLRNTHLGTLRLHFGNSFKRLSQTHVMLQFQQGHWPESQVVNLHILSVHN